MTHFDANMRNLKELQVSTISKYKSNVKSSDCEYCSRNYEKLDPERNFIKPVRRSRMFSPSSCVTNVREFCKQVLQKRKDDNFTVSNEENFKAKSNKEIKDWCMIDPEQFDMMKKIHNDLIDKTSKLVECAKKSRFLGFFSPRRLRNRIKLGNFSQITCSPAIIRRQAFSPSIKYHNLNNTNETINFDDDNKRRNFAFYEAHFNRSHHQNFDFKVNKPNFMQEKHQNSHGGCRLKINDEFILTQQLIKNNFNMPNKLI